MTAVLFWKTYREQRAIWLAILVLAILLVVSLGMTLGNGSGWEVFADERLRSGLVILVLVMTVTYGVISGAMLLAGESEEGTQVFLDSLTGRRGPLWANKCLAGCFLSLYLSLMLALLAVGLGFGTWKNAVALPLVGLDAFVWGLLGGALCRTVLKAVLVAIMFMMLSWGFSLITLGSWEMDWWRVGGFKVVPALAALYASRRIYCRDDVARRQARVSGSVLPAHFADWRVLLWLIVRQGRWVGVAGLASAVVLGLAVRWEPLVVWPLGTMVLGIACGLAVFASDQNDGTRFLATQRFPVGRVWTAKILCWGLTTGVLTALMWYTATGLVAYLSVALSNERTYDSDAISKVGSPSFWIAKWTEQGYADAPLDPYLFLGLWPLYGFCFGQFFGQLAKRPVIGLFLAATVSPFFIAVWVPSYLYGGVPIWWVLTIPVLLLVTTRLTMRSWLSGRLLTRTPMLGIASAAALMMLSLACFCWHRAVEVPDVGEPFDVGAFEAALAEAKKNEAGPLLRRATADFAKFKEKVESEFGRYLADVPEVLEPQEKERRGRWLDRVFEGDWAKEIETAIRLPAGVFQPGDSRFWETYNEMAYAVLARESQVQGRAEFRNALTHLKSLLALSRNAMNYQGVVDRLSVPEYWALERFELWLEKVGPDKELLREGLLGLRKHESDMPDSANTIKAQYLQYRDKEPQTFRGNSLFERLRNTAYHVPWERERQARIFRAVTLGNLHQIQLPARNWELWRSQLHRADRLDADALLSGLPLDEGPGSELTAMQWERLIDSAYRRVRQDSPWWIMWTSVTNRRAVRAAELVTALALYQAEQGKLPAKLEDLVPDFLPGLLVDPFTGQPFHYRISMGEVINNVGQDKLTLAPGQAVITAGDKESFAQPVPLWAK